MKRQLDQLETALKAMADATRLRILGLLAAGEVCVCDIHDSLRIPQPKASRHLAYLRKAGLVTARRDGLWMHYALAPAADPVVETIRQAVTHAVSHADAVRRDAVRLQRRTGCCAPSPEAAPSCACCDAATATAPEPPA